MRNVQSGGSPGTGLKTTDIEYLYVIMDHKTSHKGQFSKTEKSES